jgi:ubiquinone/menaquinone biosynthesis C-methylase UbiE
MIAPDQIKPAIRARWSLPERVEGWIGSGLNIEFHDPVCRRAWRAALKDAAGDGKAQRSALDLGTGPGTLAQLWAELGYRTTGVDFSPAMIAAARVAAREKKLSIAYLEGDAESPPFQRKRFDVISSRFVLFTLPHPGYAVRRWVELLRPGGAIVLVGHEKSNDPRPQSRRRKVPPPGKIDQRHQEALRQLPFMNHTLNDLQVLLEAVGLEDIRRVSMGQVIAARTALSRRHEIAGVHASPPFIIVGRKPSSP